MIEKKKIENVQKTNEDKKEATTSTKSIDETEYLLSTKVNKKRLQEAINQENTNETIPFLLDD